MLALDTINISAPFLLRKKCRPIPALCLEGEDAFRIDTLQSQYEGNSRHISALYVDAWRIVATKAKLPSSWIIDRWSKS
jgi:hypothetical protein